MNKRKQGSILKDWGRKALWRVFSEVTLIWPGQAKKKQKKRAECMT